MFLPIYILRATLLPLLSPTPQIPTETTLNTAINGGNPRRRGLRHRVYSDDELVSSAADDPPYRLLSRPVPPGVRGVLKPRGRNDSASGAESDGSTASGSATSACAGRRVRLVEPETKQSLVALREYWSGPESGGKSGGGIAGYRRTREIYTKGQGGTAVIRRAPRVVISATGEVSALVEEPTTVGVKGGGNFTEDAEEGKEEPEEVEDEAQDGDDENSPLRRRFPRLGGSPIPSPSNRSSLALTRPPSTSRPRARSSSVPHRSASPLATRNRSCSPASPTSSALRPPQPGSRIRSSSPLAGPSSRKPGGVTPKWIKTRPPPPSPDAKGDDAAKEAGDSDFEDMSEGGSGASTPVREKREFDLHVEEVLPSPPVVVEEKETSGAGGYAMRAREPAESLLLVKPIGVGRRSSFQRFGAGGIGGAQAVSVVLPV